jgi:hypothetical protein
LGRFSFSAMTFNREMVHGAFPLAQAARARERCFSNVFSHLAVVRCRHTSHMLTAALVYKLPMHPAGSRALIIMPLKE